MTEEHTCLIEGIVCCEKCQKMCLACRKETEPEEPPRPEYFWGV